MTSSNQALVSGIEELVQRTEALADPQARGLVVELLQAVMGLHEEALSRMLEIMLTGGTVETLVRDDLVSSVLALHGIHPEPLDTRILGAMDKLRRYFDPRGAGIALVGRESGSLRVRYTPARPGPAVEARRVIEETIYEAAPEIEELIIEGIEQPREPNFVPLTELLTTHTA